MIEGLFIYLRDERIATSKFLNGKVRSYYAELKKFYKNKKDIKLHPYVEKVGCIKRFHGPRWSTSVQAVGW